jgi:hypothetical protein
MKTLILSLILVSFCFAAPCLARTVVYQYDNGFTLCFVVQDDGSWACAMNQDQDDNGLLTDGYDGNYDYKSIMAFRKTVSAFYHQVTGGKVIWLHLPQWWKEFAPKQ